MKFALVRRDFYTFDQVVQRYLDEGYELRGETFVTTYPLYKTVGYHYNQVLVKYDDDETDFIPFLSKPTNYDDDETKEQENK